MSLILDALNRSQSERANPGDVPGVATMHYAAAPVRPALWRQGLLGLALIATLTLVVWLLVRPEHQADAEQPAVPANAIAVAPAQQPSPGAVANLERPQSSVSARTGQQTMPPQVTRSEPQPGPARVPAEGAKAQKAAPLSPEVAALYTRSASQASGANGAQAPVTEVKPSAAAHSPTVEAAPASAPVAESEVDVEKMLSLAQAELANQRLTDHPAPFISDLSQQRKDAIPTLLYSGHDYRADGNSSVLINNRTARAGQSVGKGVQVEEILPDSVVLRFTGEQFRLRALNSWVNL